MRALLSSVVFVLGRFYTKSLKNKQYRYEMRRWVSKGGGMQRHWPKVNR